MIFRRSVGRTVKALSVAAGVALAAFGLSGCQPQPHSVLVVGDGTRVALGQSTVQSGIDSFAVVSNNHTPGSGSNITLFQLKSGATAAQLGADLRDEFSQTPATAAKGTRELTRDVNAFGLADVSGTVETVTANLLPGTYYLMDLANYTGTSNPILTPLHVTAGSARGPLHGNVSVRATGTDRFAVSSTSWPHQGSYVFANTDSTSIHFMVMQRAKPGTTDAQVQAYFNSHSQSPPPYALPGPSGGNDVVAPGNTIRVAYNLPAGTYVLLCYIADATTGMPHAVMGMHKVVTLS